MHAVGESVQNIVGPQFAATAQFDSSRSVNPKCSSSNLSRGGFSLVKAATARVSTLEGELREERKKIAALQTSAAAANNAMATKDSIIADLEKQVTLARRGSPIEAATLAQLSSHTDALSAELEALRKNTIDPEALNAAEQARCAAEQRASAAERDRAHIAAEVESVKRDMEVLLRQVDSEDSAKVRR